MSRLASNLLCAWGALLLSVALVGCGKAVDPNRPKTLPTTITVTYKGQPVEGASVTLVPSGTAPDQRGAVARTDSSGQAVMWTFDPGDGVIPGSYQVAISKVAPVSVPSPEGMDPKEHARITQELESAPPKHELPEKYSKASTSGLTIDVTEGGESEFTFDLQD